MYYNVIWFKSLPKWWIIVHVTSLIRGQFVITMLFSKIWYSSVTFSSLGNYKKKKAALRKRLISSFNQLKGTLELHVQSLKCTINWCWSHFIVVSFIRCSVVQLKMRCVNIVWKCGVWGQRHHVRLHKSVWHLCEQGKISSMNNYDIHPLIYPPTQEGRKMVSLADGWWN